jgi:choice-of-anchor C domain-containing protein
MRAASLILTVAVLLSASRAQQPATLILNGSFEEGPGVVRFLNLATGDTSLPGWIVTGEGVDYVSTGYWISSDGARAIDLDGSARSTATPPYVQGGIAQTFPTVPGTRYRVTFDLAGNPNQLPRVKPLRISAAGQSVELTFDATGKTGQRMGWTPRSWTFTANAASATLEFRSLTVSPRTGFGAAIDNVAVVADRTAPLEVVEGEKEIHVTLGAEVLFDTARFDLKSASTAALQSLLTLLARYPRAPVLIEGHTDSVGNAASNQVLSEKRADAVKRWLGSRHSQRSDYGPGAWPDRADGVQ